MLLGMRAGRMGRTSSMGDVAARVAKTVLWAASWAVAMGWLAFWVSSPTEKGRAWRRVTVGKPIASSTSKFFGRSGKITNELFPQLLWGEVDAVDKIGALHSITSQTTMQFISSKLCEP